MREINTIDSNNNLFMPNNFKYVKVNKLLPNTIHEKNFIMGLQNARSILSNLEQSIKKSNTYEEKLIKCRKSHRHLTDFNDWWDSGVSEDSVSKSSAESKSSRQQASQSTNLSPVAVAESWSTMSIVCLQYQYEELSKRYEALLSLYDDRCSSLSSRDAALAKLRKRVNETHDELLRVNRALLSVGKQYIDLKCKRFVQKVWYEERISHWKCAMQAILATAERARMDLDLKLSNILNCEHDAAVVLLLSEIKKCNLLFLENLRLKYRTS